MTIEERAKVYEPDAFDADEIYPAREGHIVNRIRNAYIAGATEQKAIDIGEACKVARNMGFDGVADQIRKAMGVEHNKED